MTDKPIIDKPDELISGYAEAKPAGCQCPQCRKPKNNHHYGCICSECLDEAWYRRPRPMFPEGGYIA